jgi:hypothetical protein
MRNRSGSMTRREALSGLIVLPALAGVLASTTAVAEASGSKAQFKYQDHPNGSHQCSGCKWFHPGKTASAMGTCTVVSGAISPRGWCIAYAAK